MNPQGALSDIRILDLTQMLAGPYATMMLADHGAQVIKIEPLAGDMTRAHGPYRADDSKKVLGGYFQSINRNKHSVVLDLKRPEGREALLRLVKTADALVENFRDGVMERLGLSYEALLKANPRLVYGTLRGFGDGRTGASPYREWPAFDVVAQAMGGIMAITGPDADTPMKIGPGIGDILPGMMLAFGVLAAIHSARRTGEGQLVDIAMVDSILALCERTVYQHSLLGLVPKPEGNAHPFLVPFGIFPASDGHVSIGAFADNFFDEMCRNLGADAIRLDPRFTTLEQRIVHRTELNAALASYTSQHTRDELKELLGGVIPFGIVMNIADIFTDEHFIVREMIVNVEQPGSGSPIQIAGVPIKMTKTPGLVAHRAPLLGEDTIKLLRSAGLTEEEIRELIDKRVSFAADTSTREEDVQP